MNLLYVVLTQRTTKTRHKTFSKPQNFLKNFRLR